MRLAGRNSQADVLVVGGGPAGLAAAIALRTRGFSVTVADPGQPPIDKACGEGLLPGSLEALRRLGVLLPPEHTFPFRGIRFLYRGDSVDASFPNGTGVGIRRTHLHQALINRAEAVGVALRWGSMAKGLSETGVVLDGAAIDCRWVVGADGENSSVRQWAGLTHTRSQSVRYGFRRHYRIAPWSDCVEVYWGEQSQMYVTPIGHDEVGVALLSRDSHHRLDQALPRHPELAARLKHAPASTTERGAVSVTRRLAQVQLGRALLVGDASGSVDAITGEGLRLGFEQASALADALVNEDPGRYAAAHRRSARRPALMSALMLSLDHSAWLRRVVLTALSSEPHIFALGLRILTG